MFIDKVRISVKAGAGGNGAVAFHREKYVRPVVPMGATAARAATLCSLWTTICPP